MSYGSETWPVNTKMTRLINSFATSADRIMTGVKGLDEVRNSVVLDSVSRNDLIYTSCPANYVSVDNYYVQIRHSMPYMNVLSTHGKTCRRLEEEES